MKKLLIILVLFLMIPIIVNAEENIIIKGELFDQRADYNIFNGILQSDYFNNRIVTSSLNAKSKPTFLEYNFYSNATPLYTDRWFNDYGYNPLQRIYTLSDSLISDMDYSNSLRQWAYKAMYLSLEAASKVVIETKASIGSNYRLLVNNADYIYSLTRVESLLNQVINDLEINSNAYNDITGIDNTLTSIFNSYLYPAENYLYKTDNIVFPNVVLPSDFQELNTAFDSLVNNDQNREMINDNTTKFYLNVKKDYSVELRKNEEGMYEYNSNAFFIADNFGIGEDLDPNNGTNYFWNDSGTGHNYLFTYMFKLRINPEIDDEFVFTGDDDVWVYLSEEDNPANNFLVINLGGVHGSQSSSFKFTEGENGLLNCLILPRNASSYSEIPLRADIDPNKKYNLHLFFSERRPSGSNFQIVTNVSFIQSAEPILESNKAVYNNPISAFVNLTNTYTNETVFRLYNSLENEEPDILDSVINNQVNLLFDEAPIENATYYLTAQNPNEIESDKVPIEVSAYEIENPQTDDSIQLYYFLFFISLIFIGILSKNAIITRIKYKN